MPTPSPTFNQVADYYTGVRPEMLRVVPKSAKRVLEIGCGTGDFSVSVKRKTGAECWAIEYQPDVAEKAARVLDYVLTGDIDANVSELPDAYFDVIVANDVLEHLVNPWTTLELLRPKLAPGGILVGSIPNIRFLPALARIVFRKDFPLDDHGVFDRTHLRWFTRKSIPRMFEAAGYEVQKIRGIHMAPNPLVAIIGIASLGFLWDGVWMQYKVVATPQTTTATVQ